MKSWNITIKMPVIDLRVLFDEILWWNLKNMICEIPNEISYAIMTGFTK